MVKLVDTYDSGSYAARRMGSSPILSIFFNLLGLRVWADFSVDDLPSSNLYWLAVIFIFHI